jgi:hypothetical protein
MILLGKLVFFFNESGGGGFHSEFFLAIVYYKSSFVTYVSFLDLTIFPLLNPAGIYCARAKMFDQDLGC